MKRTKCTRLALALLLALSAAMLSSIPASAIYGPPTYTVDGVTYYDVYNGGPRPAGEQAIDLYQKALEYNDNYKKWTKLSHYAMGEWASKQTTTRPYSDDYAFLTANSGIGNSMWGGNVLHITPSGLPFVGMAAASMLGFSTYPSLGANDGPAFWTLDVKTHSGIVTTPSVYLDTSSMGVLTVFHDFKLQYLETKGAFATAAGPDMTLEEMLEECRNGANLANSGYEYTENSADRTVIGTAVNYAPSGTTTYTLSQDTTTTQEFRNSVTNTSEYGFEESAELGVETDVKIPLVGGTKISMKVGFKANQTFGKATSNETMTGTASTIGQQTTRVLPPHTIAPTKTTSGEATLKIKYDYPVVIKYKVDMYYVHKDIGRYGMAPRELIERMTGFGTGTDTTDPAQSLKNRMASVSHEISYGDGIDWNWPNGSASDITAFDLEPMSTLAPSIYNNRPIALSAAQVEITSHSETSEILPEQALYPLRSVEAPAQEPIELTAAQQARIDNIALEGYNGYYVPYYGFNRRSGHWILVDSETGTTPHDGSIAELVTTGSYRYVRAKNREGVVFLKYVIDEDKYMAYLGPQVYAANADMDYTAVIPVAVNAPAIPPAKISGRVMDGDTGAGVFAQLTLKDSADATIASDWTAADGSYEFLNVAPGAYTLTASANGCDTVMVSFSAAAEMKRNIALSKTKYAVSGTITALESGAGLPAEVTLKKDGAAIDSVTADSSGGYIFGNVTAGKGCTVTASCAGYETDTTRAFDISGSVVSKDLALKAAATDTYTLAVVGGTGGGNYTAGQSVTVTATVPAGKVFDKWTATGGGFADPYSPSTTFTMPSGNATVTANFKDAGGSGAETPYIRLWGKTTGYVSNFWNWCMVIFLFGWIWMAF